MEEKEKFSLKYKFIQALLTQAHTRKKQLWNRYERRLLFNAAKNIPNIFTFDRTQQVVFHEESVWMRISFVHSLKYIGIERLDKRKVYLFSLLRGIEIHKHVFVN